MNEEVQGVSVEYPDIVDDVAKQMMEKVKECAYLRQEALAWQRRCLSAENQLQALSAPKGETENAGKMEK